MVTCDRLVFPFDQGQTKLDEVHDNDLDLSFDVAADVELPSSLQLPSQQVQPLSTSLLFSEHTARLDEPEPKSRVRDLQEEDA